MVFDEANLPIDIQVSKLVDWLISRRHVKKNWSESVHDIRKKINNAIQDMPEHKDIVKLLSGSYINYFHCLKIIEVLKETEKDSKNIFGWYTSQRMKDWQDIVKSYELDNVYLAEAAQFLVRDVNYEIPSLKKQISRWQHVQEECNKKTEGYRKSSTMAQERHNSACKKLGVSKENIKEDILGLLQKLPEKFSQIGSDLKLLENARILYQEYIKFIFDSDRPILPLLGFVIEKGDVTLYEWKHGEPPISIERPKFDFSEKKCEENLQTDEEIDFDIEEVVSGDSCQEEEVQLETGEIDWGCDNNDDDVINYDIEVTNEEDSAISHDIVIENSGFAGGVAKNEEALSLLETETSRSQLINEILELQGFLSQRVVELKENESILSMNLFSNSPKSLQYQSPETLESYLSSISKIIRALTNENMMHLYMISSSPRYVDRLVDSLNRHLKESERALASIESIEKKRQDAIREEHALSAYLGVLVARSKILQNEVRLEISRKYNNRPVNLMGGFQFAD